MNTSMVGNSPEYLNEDTGATIIATASLMIIFCTVFVGLRYWARYLTGSHFRAEDLLIPFAWLATIGLCVVGILMVKFAGTGRHQIILDPTKITQHYKGIMINELVQPAAVAFPKVCVVLLFLHVFTNPYERIAAKALIAVILASWLSYTLAACFQCMPFAYNWDKSIPGGRCFNLGAFANSSSVPNIVTDVLILLLPMRTVIQLEISMGKKMGLLLIFLTGSVGIVASIIRTVVLLTTNPLIDATFTVVEIVNWTIIEAGLYLLAACALSFKPLFRFVAHSLHLTHLLTSTTQNTFTGTSADPSKMNASSSHHHHEQKIIRMETFKSGSSGVFSKLGSGKDGDGDNDRDGGYAGGIASFGTEVVEGEGGVGHSKGLSEGSLKVTISRTVEIDSETIDEEYRCDEAFHGAVDRNAVGLRYQDVELKR